MAKYHDELHQLLKQGKRKKFNDLRKKRRNEGKKKLHLSDLKCDGLDLHDVDLDDVVLHRVSFKGADLSGAALKNAELRNVSFVEANLHGADLSYVKCKKNVNFCLSKLGKKTNFKKTDFSGAIWYEKKKKSGKRTKKPEGLAKPNYSGAKHAPGWLLKLLPA